MNLKPLRVKLAQGYRDRLLGVGLRVTWREFDALCLPRCRAVHTLGLTQPIDIVFVSLEAMVVEIRQCIPPWRIVIARAPHAIDVWEFPAGSCHAHGVINGLSVEAMLRQMIPSTKR